MPAMLEPPPVPIDKPNTLSIKLHMDVVESARIVSAYRAETMTDMLSDILRPILATMEAEEVARRNAAATGAKRAKGAGGGQ